MRRRLCLLLRFPNLPPDDRHGRPLRQPHRALADAVDFFVSSFIPFLLYFHYMRLDITVRDLGEIDAILAFLKKEKISRVSVTHTGKAISPIDVAERLRVQMPNLDIMVYLSTKYYHSGAIADGRSAFRKAFEHVKQIGISSVLIVSGHPRTDFDSIEGLREIFDHRVADGVDVYCAFNPYFDPGRLREEQERLSAKCGFSFVKGVCFQMGMDVGKLRKGVELVKSVRDDLTLYASVPVPGPMTREVLKDASLYGVFLPNSYLLDDELAEEMTNEYLKACKELRIDSLVFAPNQEEFSTYKKLF